MNNIYVFNPTRAPQIIGKMTFEPGNYDVVSQENVQVLRDNFVPLKFEGDTDFRPFWAVNMPARTPDQIP